ncbi:MAG: helix-hairpin-helix domain-containing protein [Desulfurococcales archaeon]|nr:helix-hairpin-helix domain-containing protein [Desulfurococcales archaeon]
MEKKIRVIADLRERNTSVTKYLEEMVMVEYKQLTVGDYIISDDIAIERKSASDFVKSLFDGRLFDQAKRLSEAYLTPIMIIEGDLNKISKRFRNQARAALISLTLDYGIKIIYSQDPRETAEILAYLARKVFYSRGGQRILVHKKPKLSSISEWQLYIVQSLPNIGPKLAVRLLEMFGSVEKIFTASISELSRIPGIGEKRALYIRKILQSKWQGTNRRKPRSIL